jgi:hypothetical protein
MPVGGWRAEEVAIVGCGGAQTEVAQVERFHEYRNCMKTFKVSCVAEPSVKIPETKLGVSSPVCNTPNTVTSPQGAKFVVTGPN